MRLSFLVFLFSSLISCGANDHTTQSETESLSFLAGTLSDVSFTKSGSAVFEPASPPAAGSPLSLFRVSFNVEIDKTNFPVFAYNKARWKLGFQKSDNTGDIVEISDAVVVTGAATLTGNIQTIDVALAVTFASGNIPQDMVSMLKTAEDAGRREISIVAIYRDGDTASSADRKVSMNWTADLGVIVNGPSVGSPTVSDENAVLSWSGPGDTSAVMRNASGALIGAGDSSIGGYLVAYWDVAACGGAGALWNWSTNSQLDSTGAARSITTCNYGASAAAQATDTISATTCSLGCDTTASAANSNKSEEEVAIPAFIPTAAQAGEFFDVGCYKVVRVSGSRSSVTLRNVQNGKYYGATLWAIDSSGHISLGRSACVFAKPTLVPLPADGLTGGKSKSKSDCFVVTAASGNSNSTAVHYWRIIRDTLLEKSAFIEWYYKSGPSLAASLDSHPVFKPAVNFVLEKTGAVIVFGNRAISKAIHWFEEASAKALNLVERVFVSEANASDGDDTVPNDSQSSFKKSRFDEEVSAHVQLSVGLVDYTTTGKLWDAYFRSGSKPKKLFQSSLSAGYSVIGLRYGELSLGGQGTYFSAQGSVPAVLPNGAATDPLVAGRGHVAYAFSAFGMTDLRLRFPHPWFAWFAPRVSYLFGWSRLRMEAQSGAGFSSSSSDSAEFGPSGYTLVKQMSAVRVAGEFYFGGFLTQDVAEMRSVYGVQDFGVSVFMENWRDASKSISMDSSVLGIGLTMLLL